MEKLSNLISLFASMLISHDMISLDVTMTFGRVERPLLATTVDHAVHTLAEVQGRIYWDRGLSKPEQPEIREKSETRVDLWGLEIVIFSLILFLSLRGRRISNCDFSNLYFRYIAMCPS